MIDPKLLRTNPDLVRRSQEARGESVELVDKLVGADESRRSAIATFENLRAEQKELGKQVARAQGEERAAVLVRTASLSSTSNTCSVPPTTSGAAISASCIRVLSSATGSVIVKRVPIPGSLFT